METKNAKIVYPLFEPNQILSSTHLNNLRNFLDTENRVSRTLLSGVGIVCGLNARMKNDSSAVLVTPGYGITTDGYLLELNHPDSETAPSPDKPIEYPYYKAYTYAGDPPYLFGKQTDSIKEVLLEADLSPLMKARTIASIREEAASIYEQNKIFELSLTKPKNGEEKEVSTKIGPANYPITEMCVVLYCEAKDEDLRSCTGSNCDNKGKQREYRIKVLLVHKSLLPTYNPQTEHTRDFNLPQLEIRRVASEFTNANPISFFTTNEALQEEFSALAKKQAFALTHALDNVQSRLWKMGLTSLLYTDAIDRMQTIASMSVTYSQYKYDLFCDLTMTWNEFAEAAEDWMEACGVLPDDFPRHLTLCLLKEDTRNHYFDEYRNYFYNSAPIDKQDRRLLKMQMLWQKLLNMIMFFDVPATKDTIIKITPGKFSPAPLSDWAVPYYYNHEKVKNILLRFWNPKASLRSQERDRNGYYSFEWSSNPVHVQPLLHSIKDKPFYRIEGIAGVNYDEAIKALEELRQQNNLAFDIVALKIKDDGVVRVDGQCGYKDLDEEYIIARNTLIDAVEKVYEYMEAIFGVIRKELDKSEKGIMDEVRDYIFSLREITLELLPPCLKNFDYDVFKEAYKTLLDSTVTWLLRQLNGATTSVMEKWLEKSDSTIGNIVRSFVAELTYGLTNALAHNKLYNVYYRLKLRQYKKSRELVLSRFAVKHPGLEHISGVMNGGTFVMVYRSDEKDRKEIFDGIRRMQEVVDAFGRIRASVEEQLRMQRELEELRKLAAEKETVTATAEPPLATTETPVLTPGDKPGPIITIDDSIFKAPLGDIVTRLPKDELIVKIPDGSEVINPKTSSILDVLSKNISGLEGADKTNMTKFVRTLGEALGINPAKTETESKLDDLKLKLEEIATVNNEKIGSTAYATDIVKLSEGLNEISASISKGTSVETFAADIERANNLTNLLASSVESDAAKITEIVSRYEIEESAATASPLNTAKTDSILKTVTPVVSTTTSGTIKLTGTAGSLLSKTSTTKFTPHSDNSNKPVKLKKKKTKYYNALTSLTPIKLSSGTSLSIRLNDALTENEKLVLSSVVEKQAVTETEKEVLTNLAVSSKITETESVNIAAIAESGNVESTKSLASIIEKSDALIEKATLVRSVIESTKVATEAKETFALLLDDSRGKGIDDLANIREAAEAYLKSKKITAAEKKAIDALASRKEELLAADESRKTVLGIIESNAVNAAEKETLKELIKDSAAGMTFYLKVDELLKKTDSPGGKRILGETETEAIINLLDEKKAYDPEATVMGVLATKVTDSETKSLLGKLLNPKLGNGFREPSLIEKVITTSGLAEKLSPGERKAFDTLLADKRDSHAADASRNTAKDLIYSNKLTPAQFNTIVELMSDDKYTPALENKFRVFFEEPKGAASKVTFEKETIESLRDLLNRKKSPGKTIAPALETEMAIGETLPAKDVFKEIAEGEPIFLPPKSGTETTKTSGVPPASAEEVFERIFNDKPLEGAAAKTLFTDFTKNLALVSAELSARIAAGKSVFKSKALARELFDFEPKNINQKVVADFALPYQCCSDLLCADDCVSDKELAELPIPPFAKDDFAVTILEHPVNIPVLLNDHAPAGNKLILEKDLALEPLHGTVELAEPLDAPAYFIYKPTTDKPREDHFRYRVKNSQNGLYDEANVWVRIADFPPPVFDIDSKDICYYDKPHMLIIDLKGRNPQLVTVDGPGFFISRKDGMPYFDPNAPGVNRGDNVLYMFYGATQIAELHINILKPEARFIVSSITANASGGADIQLKNQSIDADFFEWRAVGEFHSSEKFSNDRDPFFSFTAAEIGVAELIHVTLKAYRSSTVEACISPEVTQHIPVQIELPASITAEKTYICQKEKPVKLTIDAPARDPKDLTLSTEGTFFDVESQTWFFNPSGAGVVHGTNTIRLYDKGVEISHTDVIVLQPVANFTRGLVEPPAPPHPNSYIIHFNNTSVDANRFNWNVEGKLSNDKDPVFEFTEAELKERKYNLNVILVASHSRLTCNDSREAVVTIDGKIEPPTFEVNPKAVCSNDPNPVFNITAPGRNLSELEVQGNGAYYNNALGRWEVFLKDRNVVNGDNDYKLVVKATGETLAMTTLFVSVLTADFSYYADTLYGSQVVLHLTASSNQADNYDWTVAGVIKSSGKLAVVEIPWTIVQAKNGIIDIVLNASNSSIGCSVLVAQQYTVSLFPQDPPPINEFIPDLKLVQNINNYLMDPEDGTYTYSSVFFETETFQQVLALDNMKSNVTFSGYFNSVESVVQYRQTQQYKDMMSGFTTQLDNMVNTATPSQYMYSPYLNDLQRFFKNGMITLISLIAVDAQDININAPYMPQLVNIAKMTAQSPNIAGMLWNGRDIDLLNLIYDSTREKPDFRQFLKNLLIELTPPA